jgi:predicted phosphoadenosine phosphosulfate sulfurtransferase
LVDDIWTGAKLFGWDYNKQYDKFYKLNITPRNQRVAPFIGDGLANIKILKEAYPELWGKLVKRVPGSASGMRYADTNLYARGGVIEKPDNYTWMEWIKEYLSRYPPEYREKMVKTVKTRLKYHYKNTGEPLPEDGSKHPVSEESWKDLMVLVMLQNNFGRRGRVILKKTGDELWYQKKMKRKQTINKTK